MSFRKMKFQFASVLALVLLCLGCGTEEVRQNPETNTGEVEVQPFVSESIFIDPNNFPAYSHDSITQLLEEADVCTSDSLDPQKVLCNESLFRVWPLGPGKSLHDGFICESRSLMFNGGVSKNCIVQFKTKEGKWKRSNWLIGKLMELRTRENGYYDLILSYKDSDVGSINVLHRWDESGFFERNEVIEINDFVVKEEAKDSLYQVYLKEFRWGY